MKKFIPLLFLLGGCASLPFKITGWKDGKVAFENGQSAVIAGNPHITCYNIDDYLLADGYYVTETGYDDLGDALIIDMFGKGYAYIFYSQGDYCTLGN